MFVTTNMIITPNQTQGSCPEDEKFSSMWCTKDSDCSKGRTSEIGHGELKYTASRLLNYYIYY